MLQVLPDLEDQKGWFPHGLYNFYWIKNYQ